MIIIVMGVCATGKTTVGKLLAEKLGVPFYDADDYHPDTNIEKMKAGIPLKDEDRMPWLERLSEEIKRWEEAGGAVLACPGHKEPYRRILRRATKNVRFVYLKGSRDLISERLKMRKGHFYPPDLLDSQLAILEEPHDAIVVDITSSPEEIVNNIVAQLTKIERD